SVIDLPTAYWHELVHTLAGSKAFLPPSLRLVIIGGEAAHPEKVTAWLNTVGRYPVLLNTFGPTEATVVSTGEVLAAPVLSAAVPIGRPIECATTYVLDAHCEPGRV